MTGRSLLTYCYRTLDTLVIILVGLVLIRSNNSLAAVFVPLGHLSDSANAYSRAFGVSADGTIIAGDASLPNQELRAFRWSEGRMGCKVWGLHRVFLQHRAMGSAETVRQLLAAVYSQNLLVAPKQRFGGNQW